MKKVEVRAVDNIKPMNQATKDKHEFNKVMKNINATVSNIENFVSAVALLAVSSIAFWYAYTKGFQLTFAKEAVMFCGLYIGLKGAHLFFNHINHKK